MFPNWLRYTGPRSAVGNVSGYRCIVEYIDFILSSEINVYQKQIKVMSITCEMI